LKKEGYAPVILIPVKLPVVQRGENLRPIIFRALDDNHVKLRHRDVLAVASKVVSVAENRTVELDKTRISSRARRLAGKYQLDARLAQVVLNEADDVCGGVHGFILTIRQGMLSANAGVDVKNSPAGNAILWPALPNYSASVIRKYLELKAHVRLGVIIVDSRVTPLRLGTTGLTIGLSGFQPIQDERGRYDLYHRRVRVTQTNVVDDLAAAAHLLMGECDERIGVVVIRNARINLGRFSSSQAKLSMKKCLVGSSLVNFAKV
jgi:coenzyme F420-0:L-glutamate ligase